MDEQLETIRENAEHAGDVHDLITMLSACRAPSRAFDWAIHCRNGLQGVGAYGAHPAYTSSLDAARKLADGFYWIASEGRTRDSEPLGGAQIFQKNYLVTPLAEAEHEFVEIALCIAAIKARAA